MKNLLIYILLIISLSASANTLEQVKSESIKPCSAYIVMIYKNTQFNLLIDFISSHKDGSGIMAVSGTYFEGKDKKGVLRREVNYQITGSNNSYRLISTKIKKSIRDESLADFILEKNIPDFFIYPNRMINFSIVKQGDVGYIFSSGRRPIFFCEYNRF